jgi:hypothetical protein
MIIIHIAREISAPLDRVWSSISDLDKEPTYWHGMKSVKNMGRTDANIIEREVIISYRNSKCRETMVLNPKYSIEAKITEGPLHGTKTIKLIPAEQDKTIIEIIWNIQLVGLLEIFSLLVKRYIAIQTEKALEGIAKAAEAETFAC